LKSISNEFPEINQLSSTALEPKSIQAPVWRKRFASVVTRTFGRFKVVLTPGETQDYRWIRNGTLHEYAIQESEMSDNPAQQVLTDLFGYLESLETQCRAVSQFLRDKEKVTDQQLAPYLEQAANASSVKWRAARVRMEHLFAVSEPSAESRAKTEPVATKTLEEEKVKTEDAAKKTAESTGEKKAAAESEKDQPNKPPKAQAASDNGQLTKKDAVPIAPAEQSATSKPATTSGDAEHPEAQQQKAS
jgi:hypothetical protein